MEFHNEKLGVRFKLPEKITVRNQMAYYSEAAYAAGEELFYRLWRAACTLIVEWECERIPAPPDQLNIEEVTDPKITDVIIWSAMAVQKHMNSLEQIPKN